MVKAENIGTLTDCWNILVGKGSVGFVTPSHPGKLIINRGCELPGLPVTATDLREIANKLEELNRSRHKKLPKPKKY